ncbi:MAG TPA: TonB-dependent receptor [Pseudolabrys sp.]|nr:TonB-dependent receptor [Pseudolabrys sp.]
MAQSAKRITTLLAAVGAAALSVGAAQAQQANNSVQLPEVDVNATNNSGTTPANSGAYAATPTYNTPTANLGPLGAQSILNTPTSVTVVPEELIVNQQAHTVNEVLNFLPSVEVRDQQGFEVSRPQSRGFQGSIVQNTRIDGLNAIGTTAVPTEDLAGIQVLNGLAGSLYGPETPAGVFNYVLKRPTDTPILRFSEGYDSNSVFTEQADVGGRAGSVGYRINAVHGEGQSYVPGSYADRTLFSSALDFHLDDKTVVETDFSHYRTQAYGLPGSIVYDGGKSTVLPSPPDPTKAGYGQPGAGTDLTTDTGLVKLKHQFNDSWSMEIGGLYQNAVRNLYGITNTMTDNNGNFTVTKNFNAVPHFTIGSNTASLNGHVDILGFQNDLTFGTNGFMNGQYSYRNSIAQVLGTSTLANPVVFSSPPVPNSGGEYKSGELNEQSFIVGDMLHFNEHWAVQGVLSSTFLNAKSYNVAGQTTSSDSVNGELSPTVSLIYKPIAPLTFYATYANSVEEGDQAPAGTVNANAYMAPYHDQEYEAGVKYALSKDFLITLDGFQMTRPLAATDSTTNIFQVIGTQKNTGVELFAQGAINPDISIFGGVTYIDARLQNTGNALTNDKFVVGVPQVKSDVALDYHPAFLDGVALTAAGHYESQRAATNTNNSYAAGYATLDIGARYSIKVMQHNLTARFQVLNVTDTNYYVSIADGNIVGSPGANTAYLGTPRTFMASLEADF